MTFVRREIENVDDIIATSRRASDRGCPSSTTRTVKRIGDSDERSIESESSNRHIAIAFVRSTLASIARSIDRPVDRSIDRFVDRSMSHGDAEAEDARANASLAFAIASHLRALGARFAPVSRAFERACAEAKTLEERIDFMGIAHEATYEDVARARGANADDVARRVARELRKTWCERESERVGGQRGMTRKKVNDQGARVRARATGARDWRRASALTSTSTVPRNMNCLRTFRGHRDAAYCAVLSASGRRIVTGGDDRLVKIWCAHNGLLRAACRGHVGEITYVAIDSREELVASASTDTSIRTWKLESGTPVAVLLGHARSITELHFCPAAPSVLLSTADDGTIRLWNAKKSSNEVKPLVIDLNRHGAIEGGRAVGVDEEDLPLAAVMQDGVADGPMRTRGDQLNAVASSNSAGGLEQCQVICGAFSAAGDKFAVGTSLCKVHVWSLDSDAFGDDISPPAKAVKMMLVHAKHLNDVVSIFFAHSGDRILTASKDGQARIWEPDATGKRFICSRVLTTPIEAEALRAQLNGGSNSNSRRAPIVPAMHIACWSTDDRYVIASMGDNSIRVFDVESGNVTHNMRGHTSSTYVLQSNPLDSRLVMSASYDGKVIIWDIVKGMEVRVFDGSHYNTQLVDGNWHPDGATLIVSDLAGQFSIFGTGDSTRLLRAKYEQFLQTEFVDDDLLGRSERGHLINLATGALLNEAFPRNLLCDSMGDPYPDPYQSAFQSGQLASFGSLTLSISSQPQLTHGISSLAPMDVEGPWTAPEMVPEPPSMYRMSDDDEEEDAGAMDDDDDDDDVDIDEDEEEEDDSESDFGRRSRQRRSRSSRSRRRTRRSDFNSDFSDESDDSWDQATRRSARESRAPQRLGVDTYYSTEEDEEDAGLRITRRRRRELDELKATTDAEDESEEEKPTKRAKAVRSRSDIRLHDAYSWLCSSDVTVGSYVPQLGDDVVYVAQGHCESLRHAGRSWQDEAPWQALTSMRFVEPCRVTSLRFVIADDDTFETHCLLTLKLLDSSIADGGKDFLVRFQRGASPDFLIPLSRYKTAEACEWKRGDNCAALWDNTGCGDMEPWYGMIDKTRSHEGEWAGSPWNALCVQYFNVQNEDDRFMDHSFWELYADDVMKKEHAKLMAGASSSRTPHRAKFADVDSGAPRLSGAVTKELLGRVTRAMKNVRFEAFVDVIGPNEAFVRENGEKRNYCSVVPVPMALKLIEERLKRSYYRQIDAFKSDVELIRLNCEIFHGENGAYTAVANDLEEDLTTDLPEREDDDTKSSVWRTMKSYPAIVREQQQPPEARAALRVRMRRG